MNEIIAQLFNARDIAHALHLRTRSFAQHLALGDFYTKIVELADALAESYAGRYAPVDVKLGTPAAFVSSDAISFIRGVASWAEGVRTQLNPADTFIVNQWDEVLALVNQTKYKLENLA